MSAGADYDRRGPAPENVLFSAYIEDDPTNFRFLEVFRHEGGGSVTVAFVEDTGCPHGLDVHDMIHLNAQQCDQLGSALLATARSLNKRR